MSLRKFTNFYLLFLCLLFYLFRGKAQKIPLNSKRILVLRWKPHVGDIVYITPMFRAIKTKHSSSKLYVVGAGRVEEVIRHNPDVDEYINYENNFWEIVRRLRKEKIDFACLANPGSTMGFAILYLAGIKCISVFSLASGRGDTSFSYSILKKLAITAPFYTGRYVPPQYLKLLEPISTNTGDAHFRLYFSKEAENKVNDILIQNNISANDFVVAFAPGGAVPERWWPADRFAELAKILHKEHNAKILLIGAGKDEKPIAAILAALGLNPTEVGSAEHFVSQNVLGGVPAVNLLNQNLDEFKATISKCDLVIGNDSGPMVTADAFDVANLVFIGPTDEREYHLSAGPRNRILKGRGGDVNAITINMAKSELSVILRNIR